MFTKEPIKQFLKPTKKKILVLIVFIVPILAYFHFVTILCISTSGIGKVYHCLVLNNLEGKTCYKKTDCNEEQKCILEGVNMMRPLNDPHRYEKRWLRDTIYKNSGVCRTNEGNGCNTEVNEDGSIGASGCSDSFIGY